MRDILKKISIVIVILIMVFNVGCAKNNDIDAGSNTIESEEEFRSFEEAIEISDCAVNAEFISYHDKGDFVEYEFNVKEVLYGDVPEKNIFLFSMKGTSHVEEIDFIYDLGDNKYKTGDEYLLILEKNDSLFYEHVRYILVTNIFIPLTNAQESTMYGQPITVNDKSKLNQVGEINKYVENIKNLSESTSVADEIKPSYTDSTDMKTIVSESDLILEVSIEDLKVEGLVHNGNTYTCDVSDIIKGDSLEKGEDGKILVTFLKGSVEVGGKYVIAVNKVDKDSIIYTQSSKNSVIPVNDKKILDEIGCSQKENSSYNIVMGEEQMKSGSIVEKTLEPSEKSSAEILSDLANQEFTIEAEKISDAYEPVVIFGESFVNLYTGAVAEQETVSFENYISNENLLKFINKMLELEQKKELVGGIGVVFGLENEFNEVEFKELDANLCYLSLSFSNQGSGMTCKMLIQSEIKSLKIVDLYFGNRDGVDTIATGHHTVRKLDNPKIWDDQEWVDGVFQKIREYESELLDI